MPRIVTILAAASMLAASAANATPSLSGQLAGVLPPGQYQVTADIWVAAGDTLTILPPADLRFYPDLGFDVYGRLTAVGAEGDSIRFLGAGATWDGLHLQDAEGRSRLAYCRISDAGLAAIFCVNSALDLAHVDLSANAGPRTGGLRGYLADVTLVACRIRDNVNDAGMSGSGGVHLTSSLARLEDCEIRDNQAGGVGTTGGLYAGDTDLVVSRCTIAGNRGAGNGGGVALVNCAAPRLVDCAIRGNEAGSGGGANLYGCPQAALEGCAIEENTSHAGGGVRCNQGDLTLRRCLVARNVCLSHWYSPGWGGGILVEEQSRLSLVHCTVTANVAHPWEGMPPTGDGIYAGFLAAGPGNLELRNCIVAHNRGGGGGVFAVDASVAPRITYGDFFDNAGGDFTGEVVDPQLGVLVGLNANGDPCDAYLNILADPRFRDPAAGDYHLRPTSACIDAGDPADPYDPDGTVADQGAYWFDQVAAAPNDPAPTASLVEPLVAAPNPFNPRTTLSFRLAHPTPIRLAIHDLRGRCVRILADEVRDAGWHRVTWDGRDDRGRTAPAGAYIATLGARDERRSTRLLLVR